MIIGGKERPIKIGLNQSIIYCELRGISITKMNDDFVKLANGSGTGAEVRDLIWSALKDGARKAKEPFEVDNFEVGDWLEEMEPEQMATFMNDLASSMPKVRAGKGKKKVVTGQ